MKQGLLLVALVIVSLLLGNVLGQYCLGLSEIRWMGETYDIGFSTFDMDLIIMTITLGARIKVCIAQALVLLIGLLCYPKLNKLIFG